MNTNPYNPTVEDAIAHVLNRRRSRKSLRGVIPEGFFTVNEAAEIVNVSTGTLRRWRRDGLVQEPEHWIDKGKVRWWLYSEDDIREKILPLKNGRV